MNSAFPKAVVAWQRSPLGILGLIALAVTVWAAFIESDGIAGVLAAVLIGFFLTASAVSGAFDRRKDLKAEIRIIEARLLHGEARLLEETERLSLQQTVRDREHSDRAQKTIAANEGRLDQLQEQRTELVQALRRTNEQVAAVNLALRARVERLESTVRALSAEAAKGAVAVESG